MLGVVAALLAVLSVLAGASAPVGPVAGAAAGEGASGLRFGSAAGRRPVGATSGTTSRTTSAAGSLEAAARQAQVEIAVGLLQRRADAVLRRDRDAWLSTIADPASAFGGAQVRVFDTVQAIRLRDFGYAVPSLGDALPPARARVLGADAFTVSSIGRYAYDGFDRGIRTYRATFTVVRVKGRWALAADSDGTSERQVWEQRGLRVVRSGQVLVLGTASTAILRRYRDATAEAITRVAEAWSSGWSRRVVVVVPATASEFGRLTSFTDPSDAAKVSAVTQSNGARGTDLVVVNPEAMDEITSVGRRVVLTHEVTHVAVRASTSVGLPIWLDEGLAEYVAYRGTGVPVADIAPDVAAVLRGGGAPPGLPTEADFDPATAGFDLSYQLAWAAVDLIVRRDGQDRLVRFVRAVGSEDETGRDTLARESAAFDRYLGNSRTSFLVTWRHDLARLAHDDRAA